MTVIEKQCKHCGSKFTFDYEPCGKGSGNRLKRPYCSSDCALLHKKLMKTVALVSRLKKICVECNREFYVPRCLSHRQLCSNECRYKHTSRTQIKHHEIQLNCVFCQKAFLTKSTSRKFCSHKCMHLSRIDHVDRICENCGKQFDTKRSYVPRFCSKQCTFTGQSKGLVASHVNGRTGYRLDIKDSPYFKSSFEADYYRYCVQVLNVVPQYELQTFNVNVDGKHKFYTPDFWFSEDNRFVELKGVRESDSRFSQLLNSNSRARNVAIAQGHKIDVIYMNDFYSQLRTNGLYDLITNLEHRDYAGTKHLIRKHVKD